MKKITKIQVITIIFIIGWIIWEIYLRQWAKTEVGAIIRTDLILIFPILVVLILISLFQLFTNRKRS